MSSAGCSPSWRRTARWAARARGGCAASSAATPRASSPSAVRQARRRARCSSARRLSCARAPRRQTHRSSRCLRLTSLYSTRRARRPSPTACCPCSARRAPSWWATRCSCLPPSSALRPRRRASRSRSWRLCSARGRGGRQPTTSTRRGAASRCCVHSGACTPRSPAGPLPTSTAAGSTRRAASRPGCCATCPPCAVAPPPRPRCCSCRALRPRPTPTTRSRRPTSTEVPVGSASAPTRARRPPWSRTSWRCCARASRPRALP
mmetsp:Transcript_793/g.1977  ORF Transcript_793/g.1977 Transcript_793/m.1977 type:complete len:263 (+) Transcript_793:551-1339(+)